MLWKRCAVVNNQFPGFNKIVGKPGCELAIIICHQDVVTSYEP